MFLVIALGVIQGATEFLPISSSGHLFLVNSILGGANKIAFFVWLHLATLFAVLVFFYRDVLVVLKKKSIVLSIALATLITFLMAMGIDKFFGVYFGERHLIFFGFMVTAFFLLSSRYSIEGKRSFDDFTLKEAFFFGIVQGVAIFPGVSRSGTTITLLMRRGFSPEVSFRVSFLASIPVILGAFMYESRGIIGSSFGGMYLAGFLSAFLSGLVALKVMQKIVKKEYLYYFAYYCMFVGIVSLAI